MVGKVKYRAEGQWIAKISKVRRERRYLED